MFGSLGHQDSEYMGQEGVKSAQFYSIMMFWSYIYGHCEKIEKKKNKGKNMETVSGER